MLLAHIRSKRVAINRVISNTGFESPCSTKGESCCFSPLWSNGPRLHGGNPIGFVPASRGGVYIEWFRPDDDYRAEPSSPSINEQVQEGHGQQGKEDSEEPNFATILSPSDTRHPSSCACDATVCPGTDRAYGPRRCEPSMGVRSPYQAQREPCGRSNKPGSTPR